MTRTFAAALVLLAACRSMQTESTPAPRSVAADEHSHANPNQVRVTHVALDLALDFERRIAEGTARLDLLRLDRAAPLVVDVDALAIAGVTGSDGGPRTFSIADPTPRLGSAMTISLEPKDTSVTIRYSTTDKSEAMQWLAPSQTAGGKDPYVYTQGQAVLTRTWIPLQDSPGVRVTYEAAIRAPEGLTPVMSAEMFGLNGENKWRFVLDRPVPPYLIALACGRIEFREISNRCGVWAEVPVVQRARDELVDTEAMVQCAESLFGPYRWGRYDLIVLPPSFPYGGMENPRLTFATPTILAGDKSLVGLVAHELAHSWSGNLVTNATWRDFWLNEGFTVYFEQRIMEKVYGPERSEMEKEIGLHDLQTEMEGMEEWMQVLHVDLTGRHPDDAFSQVPYEKGALFLRRVEELVGRKRFDEFLRGWFDGHAFQSVTTDDFVAYLRSELLSEQPEATAKLDLDSWLRQPGLPADAPRPHSEMLARVDAEVVRWTQGAPAEKLDVAGWTTHQWLRFLQELPKELTPVQMEELDRTFGFTRTGNSEVLCEWLITAIRNRYAAADARTEEFLMNIGRRKFLKPMYTELAKTPEGLERARVIYAKARPRYHAVSVNTLDEILEWEPAG
jgi:leukotriene-A4 hydrolase